MISTNESYQQVALVRGGVPIAHTTGVRYLDRMAVSRASFFPFLWRARGELWQRTEAERARDAGR